MSARFDVHEIGGGNSWMKVPLEAVHKLNQNEVLLSEYSIHGAHATRYCVDVPRAHDHYRSTGHTDSLLVAEWTRQLTTATAHIRFAVPLGWAFVMRAMRISTLAAHDGSPVTALVTTSAEEARGGKLRGLVAHIVFTSGGRTIATGYGDLQLIDHALYRRLRSGKQMSTEMPFLRADPPVTVVREDENEWRISYNPHDPFYFDHALDHVPGMVLFQAIRLIETEQAANQRDDITLFDGRFLRYAELGASLFARRTGESFNGTRPTSRINVLDDSGSLLAQTTIASECFSGSLTLPLIA